MGVKSMLYLVLGMLITVSNTQTQQQECGKRLERNTIICWLRSEKSNAKPFDFKLCTHAMLYGGEINCADNKCIFENSTGVDKNIKWALRNYPGKLGTTFRLSQSIEKYFLGSKQRRSNTISALLKFFEEKGLSFLSIQGVDDNRAYRRLPTHEVNFVLFVEELAEEFHARGFHIGLHIDDEIEEDIVSSDKSLQRMSQSVDWYNFEPRNFDHSHFMKPWTPLKMWFGNTNGTYQYWVETLLKFFPPECLVIDLGPSFFKYTAKYKAVDPGPGSILRDDRTSYDVDLSAMCAEFDRRPDCREFWDEESSTPWAVCGEEFYSYDNPRSLRLKVDFLQKYNVTRLFFTTDSIKPDNLCNGDAFANLKAIQGLRRS